MYYLITGGIIALISSIFFIGWKLGSKNSEKSIRIKGLEDVNAHYEKMAENFRNVDESIDAYKSRLSKLSNLSNNGKVSKTSRASSGKKTEKGSKKRG